MNKYFRIGLALSAVIVVVFVLWAVPSATEPVRAQNPAAPAACPTPIKANWRIKGNCGTTAGTHFLGTSDNQALVFKTNNSERMRLGTNGNLGIGTTIPASKLHVVSGSSDVAPRLESSGTTGFAAGWDFYQGGTGKGYVGVPDANAFFAPGEMLLLGGTGTKTSIWAGYTRGLTVDTNGNVGMGTIVPFSTLQVVGNYIQFPTISGGAPPAGDCDDAYEAGRIVVRTDGVTNLYICKGSGGWAGK